MNKIAIIFIGTNKYRSFFPKFYNSVNKLFLNKFQKDFFVFSDDEDDFFKRENIKFYAIEHQKWPFITLLRFDTISKAIEELKEYNYIFFIDADMFINEEIEEAFLDDQYDLYGVQHPGFVNQFGTFEFNKKSLACVSLQNDLSNYFQGCFWGGKAIPVIDMIVSLKQRINEDLKNNIIALWHDESHMNWYFVNNKQRVKVLDPGFAYPEFWLLPYSKKIIHIGKNNNEFHK